MRRQMGKLAAASDASSSKSPTPAADRETSPLKSDEEEEEEGDRDYYHAQLREQAEDEEEDEKHGLEDEDYERERQQEDEGLSENVDSTSTMGSPVTQHINEGASTFQEVVAVEEPGESVAGAKRDEAGAVSEDEAEALALDSSAEIDETPHRLYLKVHREVEGPLPGGFDAMFNFKEPSTGAQDGSRLLEPVTEEQLRPFATNWDSAEVSRWLDLTLSLPQVANACTLMKVDGRGFLDLDDYSLKAPPTLGLGISDESTRAWLLDVISRVNQRGRDAEAAARKRPATLSPFRGPARPSLGSGHELEDPFKSRGYGSLLGKHHPPPPATGPPPTTAPPPVTSPTPDYSRGWSDDESFDDL